VVKHGGISTYKQIAAVILEEVSFIRDYKYSHYCKNICIYNEPEEVGPNSFFPDDILLGKREISKKYNY
jgi:hypothetical protein